jgi:hypothetical protein
VQDALIEDYFRYNDLSRMEADDILMNISDIERPNYEYVGICPGALSSSILAIKVKKSVITFMSLFVFVLVFLFKFSSKKTPVSSSVTIRNLLFGTTDTPQRA